MNNVIEYTLYLIPPAFVALSERNRLRFNKLKGSGKIPDIMGAKQRHVTYMVMAALSLVIIIMAQ